MADCFINRSNISTQNIKLLDFDTTIGTDGYFDTGLAIANTTIISVLCSEPSYIVGFAWQNDERINWCCSVYPTADLSILKKNIHVKGVICYIDKHN